MNTSTQHNRENVEISKLVSEMINLIADARKKDEERENLREEREKLRAETLKLQIEAQTFKLRHIIGAVVGTVVFLAAMKALLPWFMK